MSFQKKCQLFKMVTEKTEFRRNHPQENVIHIVLGVKNVLRTILVKKLSGEEKDDEKA